MRRNVVCKETIIKIYIKTEKFIQTKIKTDKGEYGGGKKSGDKTKSAFLVFKR